MALHFQPYSHFCWIRDLYKSIKKRIFKEIFKKQHKREITNVNSFIHKSSFDPNRPNLLAKQPS